jgi:K+-transporting ATPase ATPase C chain
LKKAVHDRTLALQTAHGLPAAAPVPADLVFASASGLDPHISPAGAYFQLGRVSQARGFTPAQTQACRELITRLVESPQFGVFGSPRVNVLLLNAELDALK